MYLMVRVLIPASDGTLAPRRTRPLFGFRGLGAGWVKVLGLRGEDQSIALDMDLL